MAFSATQTLLFRRFCLRAAHRPETLLQRPRRRQPPQGPRDRGSGHAPAGVRPRGFRTLQSRVFRKVQSRVLRKGQSR
eukprot:2826843-Pleurochrysis_carterae.AAC.1